MALKALATGTPIASIAQAASHLTGRQIVPGLAIITVLLLSLVILFGPGGPRPGLRRLTRASRAADGPVDVADLRDPPEDFPGAVSRDEFDTPNLTPAPPPVPRDAKSPQGG